MLDYKLKYPFSIKINSKGDEFALRDGGVLYCKTDHDLIENMKTEPPCAYQLPELNNNINIKSTLSAITKTAPSDFGSISGLFVKSPFCEV